MYLASAAEINAVTVAIAAYGAIVGSVALILQGVAWWASWRTHVRLRIGRYQVANLGQATEAVILFEMINLSAHQIKVTHVSICPERRGEPFLFIPRPLPTSQILPIEIGSRDNATVWMPVTELEKHRNLHKKVRAQLSTSDGKTFRSKRTRLDKKEQTDFSS